MNDIDRLRASILERRAARPGHESRKSTLMMNLLLASLAVMVIVIAAVKFL